MKGEISPCDSRPTKKHPQGFPETKFGSYPLPGQIVLQFLGIFMYSCELMSGPCLRWVTCGLRAILAGYSQFYVYWNIGMGVVDFLTFPPLDSHLNREPVAILWGIFWRFLSLFGPVEGWSANSAGQIFPSWAQRSWGYCLQVKPRGFNYIVSGVVW